MVAERFQTVLVNAIEIHFEIYSGWYTVVVVVVMISIHILKHLTIILLNINDNKNNLNYLHLLCVIIARRRYDEQLTKLG